MDDKTAMEQHTVDIMHNMIDRLMSSIGPIIDTEMRKSELTAKDKAIVIRCIKVRLEQLEGHYIGISVMQEYKEALTADAESK